MHKNKIKQFITFIFFTLISMVTLSGCNLFSGTDNASYIIAPSHNVTFTMQAPSAFAPALDISRAINITDTKEIDIVTQDLYTSLGKVYYDTASKKITCIAATKDNSQYAFLILRANSTPKKMIFLSYLGRIPKSSELFNDISVSCPAITPEITAASLIVQELIRSANASAINAFNPTFTWPLEYTSAVTLEQTPLNAAINNFARSHPSYETIKTSVASCISSIVSSSSSSSSVSLSQTEILAAINNIGTASSRIPILTSITAGTEADGTKEIYSSLSSIKTPAFTSKLIKFSFTFTSPAAIDISTLKFKFTLSQAYLTGQNSRTYVFNATQAANEYLLTDDFSQPALTTESIAGGLTRSIISFSTLLASKNDFYRASYKMSLLSFENLYVQIGSVRYDFMPPPIYSFGFSIN